MATILLILLAATATSTRAQADVGDSCTTTSEMPGTCADIRECTILRDTFRFEKPVTCGYAGIFPIVCCPAPEGVSLQSTDVSPPLVNFECGISRPRIIRRPIDFFRRRRSSSDPLRFRNVGGASRKRRLAVSAKDSKIDAWPWMALLGKRDTQGTTWFCGGVLINEQWVLTALHCLYYFTAEVVRLGENDYDDDSDGAAHQDINVAKTVIYPHFNFLSAYHDLALLRLESKVTIKRSIRPVCLPWGLESEKNITGMTTTLTGWGDTTFGGFPSSILQEINLMAFPVSRCDRSYSTLPQYEYTWPQGIGEETLCAGDPNGGRDACQGDSGGPLVSKDTNGRFVLAGIVSRGYGCGNKDYPGLYANLRHPPHLVWIKKVAFSNP